MIDSLAALTLEERAKIEELQDRLIECFVEHKQSAADGRERRTKELENEINRPPHRKAGDREMGCGRFRLVVRF